MYAEEVNYWKTGRSSPDTWIDQAKREIISAGGVVVGDGFISEAFTMRSSYMLAFEIGEERFKMLWPVLEPKSGDVRAARIQAATALYHEVKAACVKAKFLGTRTAFLPYLMLCDGRSVSEVSSADLVEALPQLFGGKPNLMLVEEKEQ